ncbi:putative amino acid sensor-independent protein [Rosellinia necatrix]|uniref:Putative amino acid sensor-independent protein n=1 Tax=Rosellinia necatrix TaxID=77044 RepID=A0A1W2TTR4_ROSNE|nr:putative amino acid sensor-independent protein [Rosellinia necatrix]
MASPGATLAPVSTAATINNASAWSNFTSTWTRFAPSIEDILLAGPRMLTRIGSIISFPEAIDSFGQRVVPDPTGSDYFVTTTATEMAADISQAVSNAADALADEQDPAAMVSRFTMEGGARGLGSVFSYATSKWALCSIAMAIILNRTHIFAASRRRLRLTWPIRILLRLAPLLLFAYQSRRLLQAIQCQTSPDFAEMRWGSSNKTSELMFAEPSGYLHGLSTALLFAPSDYASCRAINMIPASDHDASNELRGSLSQLWPLFQTISLSHFIETVSCAVQGRPVAVETSMTLFEHSLAFAEADAAIGNQLGWGLFSSGSTPNITFQQASGANIAISRSMIMNRVNTPPEVLFIAFLSSMSHITSHTLALFGLQNKYRLVSTGFWAVCFMGSLLVEAFDFTSDNASHMGLLRFPTVCIIGFVPHLMVFAGILMCFAIYAFAVILAAMEPPEPTATGRPPTWQERIRAAHENMQANISLADIRISRSMDFYTALLRTGFGVITMASEAVYLNEDRGINIKERTWLEEERYRELESLRMQWAVTGVPGDSSYDSVGTIGLVPIKDGQAGASSGFARERAAQDVPKSRIGDRRSRDGVGAAERSSRWILALEFLMSINRLVLRWLALIMLKGLVRIGVRRQPWILVYFSRWPTQGKNEEKQSDAPSKARPKFVRTKRHGLLLNDETADVEAEVRKRLRRSPETINLPEEELDSRLYDSWKHGDLWGGVDTSGDWNPDGDTDSWDTTSVITSLDEGEGSTGDEWEDNDDEEVEAEGQRTPTQSNFIESRESTPPDLLIGMPDLARLLHPRTPDERHEAHALAAHLNSDRIVTRSQYARMQHNQRARLLLSSHAGRRRLNQGRMTEEEQADLLEQLILARRAEVEHHEQETGTHYSDDAEGDGDAGPVCVVCHAAPRKIIVWPCRCLSLCDECRVSLAMNNFDKCVCCRREVFSFSRIYVP